MSNIVAFDFESHDVRVVVGLDGEPWFVAADVCLALSLPETHKAVGRLDDDELSHTPLVAAPLSRRLSRRREVA